MAIYTTSCRSSMYRDAVVSTVLDHFCEKSMSSSMPRRNNNTKQVRDDLALLISAGENTDEYVEDLRRFNGRDGTQFTKFVDTVAGMLSENGQLEAHSRRCTSIALTMSLSKHYVEKKTVIYAHGCHG